MNNNDNPARDFDLAWEATALDAAGRIESIRNELARAHDGVDRSVAMSLQMGVRSAQRVMIDALDVWLDDTWDLVAGSSVLQDELFSEDEDDDDCDICDYYDLHR